MRVRRSKTLVRPADNIGSMNDGYIFRKKYLANAQCWYTACQSFREIFEVYSFLRKFNDSIHVFR